MAHFRIAANPLRAMLAVAMSLACLPSSGATNAAVESLHVVAGGGGTVASGNERLSYTIGEPVAGIASNSGTVVFSGFLATLDEATVAPDALFADGFE